MSTNNNNNNNNTTNASSELLPYLQPPNFTSIELEEIQRLWDVQNRLIPNVYPTSDSRKNNNNNQPSLNHGETMRFISRISTFASAVLIQYQQQQQPWSNDNHPCNPFVKPIGQSCLESYCRLFLDNNDDHADDGFDSGNNKNNNNNNDGCCNKKNNNNMNVVRLRCGGKRVFSIHYGEFMKELNEYEFHEQKPNDTILRDKSFAGFLYFHPLQALPAVNVALAFSILRLWKKQQQQHNNGNGNEQLICEGTGSNGSAPPPPFSDKDMERIIRYLDTCHIVVRFVHATPHTPMADIKTGLINRFISVKGHVVKAKPKRLRVATSVFQCQKCGAFVTHAFDRGQYSTPTSCSNPTCKGKSFTMKRELTKYINTQELRLQESQEESTSHAGRTPRQFEVEISNDDDLIDACRPGDIISLACRVDAINSAVAAGRAGKRAQEISTYKLFLRGHSITTLSESVGTAANNKNKNNKNNSQASQYTQKQLHDITQLCHADHRCFSMTERRAFPFDLLVRSVCPSIIGHHAVKAGILLCLLGGTPPDQQQAADNNKGVTIRSNSHILIVGDPGMGKSQMLNAATQLAARSVYVGGNTSSTTGLTVTLTKEEGGETGIEAGALVLADQGVACIDELDKCKHLDGLLEAMEQQQVSIAKAGVVASLPARCSVIGAANPKHGSYNMSKTVAENLNMARPILSRFDLVFILRDRADKDQDRLVSSNIMNLYRQQQRGGGGRGGLDGKSAVSATNAAATAFPQKSQQHGNNNSNSNDENRATNSDASTLDNRVPLEKRLAWVASFNEPLPANLVRDYIAYAREFCKPQLTAEAAEILKEYYMQLRYPTDGRRRQDTVPITTRQLEALIRLSQARAKSCLRPYVVKEDALDVVELLRRSVEQVHTDEFGIIDRTRVGAAGQSNRKMRKAFKQRIQNIIGPGATCDMEDLRRVADQFECPISEFKTMIEELRNDGTLLRKGGGRYEIAS